MTLSNIDVSLEARTATIASILAASRHLVFVLAADGRCLHATEECYNLIPADVLLGKHITSFMHHDDLPVFLENYYKTCLDPKTSWTFHHRLRRPDGAFTLFESTFRPFYDPQLSKAANTPERPMCLMNAKRYQTPQATLIDSLLEHYTTNIQLTDQLRRLREELGNGSEDEDNEAPAAGLKCSSPIPTRPTDVTIRVQGCQLDTIHTHETGPLVSVLRKPESVDHLATNSVQMHRKVTFARAPVDSVIGDAGIEMSGPTRVSNRRKAPYKKRTRDTSNQERQCEICGASKSPEWRRGPSGPKTLCNSCGRKYPDGIFLRELLIDSPGLQFGGEKADKSSKMFSCY